MKFGNVQIALVIGSVLACGVSPAAHAQKAASTSTDVKVSQGKITRTETTTASVVVANIDRATRHIMLKDASGKLTEIEAGPEVHNFDQLKVGDKVRAKYVQALSLELKKAGAPTAAADAREGAIRAPAGAKPGAAVGQVMSITAEVVALDPKTQTVTVRGPKGQTVDLGVKDPAQFRNVKVGDHVEAVYAEALAVGVEAAN